MAYIVGSASVEIIPDFKNAQLAITKFFNSKPDQYKIPVQLDIKDADTKNVEQQAERAGSRVSEALNRGAAKNDAAATRAAEKIARDREKTLNLAHSEALRIQAQMDREAAREAERLQKTSLQAINNAYAEALRIQAQMDRDAARSEIENQREITRAHTEALRINERMDREAERFALARQRRAEIEARDTLRLAERTAAERLKIDAQATAIAEREAERVRREEERFAVSSARATLKAVNDAIAEREKIRLQIEIDEQNAIMEGRRTGGLVTRAVQAEIQQNAGLISAVLAGVLAVGAPAAIAGATALFAGIGAVGAFQSERLRATWVGLWDEIKSGAVSDSAVLIPAYERMAGSIGESFQRMRPLIRDAFTATEPLIDSFSASLTRTAENALPGLVRAVQGSGPVIDGLGNLLERTGTGLSAFFDRITASAPAAGMAFSELGSSMEVLLPVFGELLGQGAELAAVTLPVLTGTLTGLLSVLDAVGGALPAIGAGFLAFRAAQGTGRLLTGWSQSLAMAAMQGGMFSGAMNKAAGGLTTVGRAAPAVGIAMALYAAAAADSEQRTNDWTAALNEGGAAASRAREEMRTTGNALSEASSGFSGFALSASGASSAVGIYADDVKNAEQANRDYLDSLTPIESAQRQMDIATRALGEALGNENTTSAELAEAKARVARAAQQQAAAEDDLARATRGVTEAMAEQADAARARVDAAFGYEQAVLDTAEAQEKYAATLTDTEASAGDVAQALLDLNKAYSDQVAAAGELARSNLPAAMNDQQVAIVGAAAELAELNKLIAQGVVLPPSMEQYRQSLIGITSQANGAMLAQAQLTAALGEIGVAVSAIPDSKAVVITSPTSDAVLQRLRDLGFTVTTLPDGTVRVEPKTAEAEAALGNLSGSLANLDSTTATPTVDANGEPYRAIANSILASLGLLGSQNPRPTVTAIDQARPLIATIMGDLGNVGRQRPAPSITAIDQASGTIGVISRALGAIQSKTVTITTNYITSGVPVSVAAPNRRDGGAIDAAIQNFDGGGAPRTRFLGATYGRGGTRDDLVPAWVSPGEHVFDARDVALMGGQSEVYAFREMLNSGQFRRPSTDTGVRQMVTAGAPRIPQAPAQAPRQVQIVTYDNPRAIIRAMNADEQQQAALASPWP